jgi:2-iminobutanoate/2-iminopropanoate deaminase
MSADPVQRREIKRYVCNELTKPLPIYSHATIYAGVAHISAVQGFVPGTFGFPEGGAAGQADQMMQNLSKILKGIGSDFDRILKMTLYFTNLDRDFPAVNEVVNRYIPELSPARSSLGVAALPRAALVVVDCTVVVDEAS